MPTAIRAVIFDFGGVIIPGEGGPDGPFAQLERRFALPDGFLFRALYLENEGWRRLRVGEGSEREWSAGCLALLRGEVGETRATELFAAMQSLRPQGDALANRKPVFNEGMLDLMARLRTRCTVSLLSNAAPGLEAELRDHYRIHNLFHDVINSATVRLAKPDPRIYHLAAARLALPPEACFFTDDLAHNIEAARGVGFTGHLFEGCEGLVAALEAAGVDTR